jgi:hypothetical protein
MSKTKEFWEKNKKLPYAKSEDQEEATLGRWLSLRRNHPYHRAKRKEQELVNAK